MFGPGSAGRLTEPQRGASPPALVLPLATESAAPPFSPPPGHCVATPAAGPFPPALQKLIVVQSAAIKD